MAQTLSNIINPIVMIQDKNDMVHSKNSGDNSNNNNINSSDEIQFIQMAWTDKLKAVGFNTTESITYVLFTFVGYTLDDAINGILKYNFGFNTFNYVKFRWVCFFLYTIGILILNVLIIKHRHEIIKKKYKRKNNHDYIHLSDELLSNNDNLFNNNNNINETENHTTNVMETAWDYLVDTYSMILIKSIWLVWILIFNNSLAIHILYLYAEGSLGFAIAMSFRCLILILSIFVIILISVYYRNKKQH